MKRSGIVLLGLAWLAAPSAAQAQVYLAPNVGYDFGGSAGSCPSLFSNCEEKKTSYGVTFGALKWGVIGVEEDFTYAPNFFGDSPQFTRNNVATLMTNLVVGVPAGPVRPYVSAGVGVMLTHVDATLSGISTSFSQNGFGYDVGGGVMILFPHHLGLRGDLRHLHSASDVTIAGIALNNTKLNFTRASVGIVIH